MTRNQVVILVLVLCVVFLFFPAFGPHTWGYWNWSPLGLAILALILVLVL